MLPYFDDKKEAFMTLLLTFTAALTVVYWPTNNVRWGKSEICSTLKRLIVFQINKIFFYRSEDWVDCKFLQLMMVMMSH